MDVTVIHSQTNSAQAIK